MSRPAANFIHSLVAILGGNAAYFLLGRYLPLKARHVPFHIDIGLLVDFWLCLVVFGLIKMIAARSDPHRQKG